MEHNNSNNNNSQPLIITNNSTSLSQRPTSPKPSSSSPPKIIIDNNDDVILEGYMLKQAIRRVTATLKTNSKYYHNRYFVLRSNNTLQYFRRNGDGKCKGTYYIQNNDKNGCDITDLFVDKHQKKIIYCFKINFTSYSNDDDSNNNEHYNGINYATSDNDDEENSSLASRFSLTDDNNSTNNNNDNNNKQHGAVIETVLSTAEETNINTSSLKNHNKRSSPFKKSFRNSNKQKDEQVHSPKSSSKAYVHHESSGGGISSNTPMILRRRKVKNKKESAGEYEINNIDSSLSKQQQQQQEPPSIPKLVEVDAGIGVAGHHTTKETTSTVGIAPAISSMKHSSYDEEEQEELRNEYITNKKQNKRKTKAKLITGTKYAAAAGATVGVAVVTAGVGLMAGIIALGVASAAGGGGAAVNALSHSKDGNNSNNSNTSSLVIASYDFDEIKQWRAILIATLESESVQKSTWGYLFLNNNDNITNNLIGRKTRAALLPKIRTSTNNTNNNNNMIFPSLSREMSFNSFSPIISNNNNNNMIFTRNNCSSRWVPLEGGILSFLGSGYLGLRIFREERNFNNDDNSSLHGEGQKLTTPLMYTHLSVEDKPCPPMKANIVLSTSPLDAFLCLMSHGRVQSINNNHHHRNNNNMIQTNNNNNNNTIITADHRVSFEVLESIDEHTDIIHMTFRPIFLFPSWSAPRDFSLYRYWRLDPDGTYVVCYESVDHPRCPIMQSSQYVRGEMHAVFNIAPQKKLSKKQRTMKQNRPIECMMTATVQVDPRGWVPTTSISCFSNQAYGDAFGINALLQLVDIRDAIDQDRFVPVATDYNDFIQQQQQQQQQFISEPIQTDFRPYNNAGESSSPPPPGISRNLSSDTADDTLNEDLQNYDFTFACNESTQRLKSNNDDVCGITSNPSSLTMEMWAEPDSNSFRVRGASYKSDKKKYNAGPSIGRLIAVDVVSVDEPIYSGFSIHPTERMQLALKREKEILANGDLSDLPPFIFIVNIVLPGPPFYHGVYYYAIDDMSTINGTSQTPSSLLCEKFFFSGNDEFRDKTFKLIPQIVQGNFIVRKAVGSTPAIMGKKLRQLYVQNDRYFEVILDCGSSPVATGVIRLSLGYAKTLVVDMGFLFEGDDDEYLPERIFGCVRMKNIDFGPRLRHVKAPVIDYNNNNSNIER